MVRQSLLAVATAFSTFALSAAPIPKHLMKDEPPYWPTAVGTKWVYVQDGKEHTEEITKAESQKNGILRLTVRVRNWDETFDVAPDGVTLRMAGHFTIDSLMVRFPIKSGDSWTFVYPIQKGLLCEGGKITVGEEEDVKVLAGTFRATKVVTTVTEVDGKPINKPRTYTHWYAKGVGLVRLEWDGGGRELKSFTPAKK